MHILKIKVLRCKYQHSECYFFLYSGAAIRQHFILTKDVSGPTETRGGLRTESVGSQLIFTMLNFTRMI